MQDALLLGQKMMEHISSLKCLSVCVTFLDELSCYDEHTVSMMSTVDENEPEKRNFQIIRKAADGLAHAIQLSHKYGLDFETLTRRLKK